MVRHCKDCPAPMPKIIQPVCKAADGIGRKAYIVNMLPIKIIGKFIIDEPIFKTE